MTKDIKRKLLAQQQVFSRMNFLFQAAHLMADQQQPKLAAYYGKLCRNVGTKAVMRMAPAVKRQLCRRCSQPLIPGVNTELQVEKEPEQKPKPKKKRNRRLKKTKPKQEKLEEPIPPLESPPEIPAEIERLSLFLECSLCKSRRTFVPTENQRECWLEQPEAVASEYSLLEENDL
ncbi:uncharacterized protein Rpp21 [Drosophila bipectinata]|uniref:uncharacterized protein Rpp21 n=1 Tax=Drosophila bipectinata TaxID=42026 RepID=UPI001C89C582|nr:uncharacterized protein LOC108130292 [Drosophila bipectinata]